MNSKHRNTIKIIFTDPVPWRSSIGFYTAYAMGFEKMRNYDGSFMSGAGTLKTPPANRRS